MLTTILVTGCGGDIGLNIGRILKEAGIAKNIIGCDIHRQHPGELIYDKCEVIEGANSANYFSNLKMIQEKYSVELIIPASEPEQRTFHKKNIYEINNIPVILANAKSMEIGFDKLATARFLEILELPYPWTKLVKEGPPINIPCILKSRTGSGSKELSLVRDKELVDYYIRKYPDFIWQEYLLPDDQEYTCGLFRSYKGEIRTIIFKRKLVGGRTGFGEIIYDEGIQKVLLRVAEGLDLKGSINIQLRLTDKGPIIFEINPRFSSTIMFRYLLGFQDLIWSIKEALGISLDEYSYPQIGTKIFRTDNEFIIRP